MKIGLLNLFIISLFIFGACKKDPVPFVTVINTYDSARNFNWCKDSITKYIIMTRRILVFALIISLSMNIVVLCIHWTRVRKYTTHLTDKPKPSLPSFSQLDSSFKKHSAYFAHYPVKRRDIVFVGNSLTEGFNVEEIYGNVKNRGIGGDNSSLLLKRLPKLVENHPNKIFIEIGINDLGLWGFNSDTIISNYEKIIETVKRMSKDTRIYVQSVLPTSEIALPDKYSHKNSQIKNLNSGIRSLCLKKGVTFIDLHSSFLKSGEMNSSYTIDGVHLNEAGYMVWQNIINQYVN